MPEVADVFDSGNDGATIDDVDDVQVPVTVGRQQPFALRQNDDRAIETG